MLLVVLGIAAGAAVLLGGRAGVVVAQDRAVAQAVERIPDGGRSVRPSGSGCRRRATGEPALARRARAALRHAVDEDATGLVLFRETTIAGSFAGLGGVERLRERVTLRSGRLPQPIPGSAASAAPPRRREDFPRPEGLRLVEVGEAVRRPSSSATSSPPPTTRSSTRVSPVIARAAGQHRPPPPPSSWPRVSRCSPGRLARRLPKLRLGGAARSGPAAALGGRRSRRGRRTGRLRAAGGVVQLRPRRSRRGAPRSAGDEPRCRQEAWDRRRRGGCAPLRLRTPSPR